MHPQTHSVRFLTIWFALVVVRAAAAPDVFRFVLFGDRTGSTQPGVYEQAWREAAAETPSFVVAVGDTIEGLNDATAEGEWRAVNQILHLYGLYPLYLAPGNHDIWSATAEQLFRKYAGREPRYSFDYRNAHFTILDNSRSDQFPAEELAFLEKDLQVNAARPVKFIVSHRPSWLVNVILRSPDFRLHELAKKYGVRTVIAGHLHEMLH